MRDVRWIWILHQRPEILLLVVCGTLADCDDYENTAGHGARRICPFRDAVSLFKHGVPDDRWLQTLKAQRVPFFNSLLANGEPRCLRIEPKPGCVAVGAGLHIFPDRVKGLPAEILGLVGVGHDLAIMETRENMHDFIFPQADSDRRLVAKPGGEAEWGGKPHFLSQAATGRGGRSFARSRMTAAGVAPKASGMVLRSAAPL